MSEAVEEQAGTAESQAASLPSKVTPEERDLFGRARAGDMGARDALAERYAYLGDYLARRFSGRGESPEDLRQVAAIGLLKSIDGFVVERGVQFSTYATSTIVGELKRHFRDRGWAIRVPRRLQESGMQVTKVSAGLWQELGRDPTIAEIAARAGLSPEEVVEALDAARAYSTASLDAPLSEDGGSLVDTLGANDPALALLHEWSGIAAGLEKLPVRDRRILYMRFFEDRTQSEIAESIGISQMHVSRLLTRSLQTLRNQGETL